jgi:hypothetical protein
LAARLANGFGDVDDGSGLVVETTCEPTRILLRGDEVI